VIPDDLIDRKKQGFGVPVYEWIYDKLGHTMRETLREFCHQTDLLDWANVEKYLRAGRGSKCWYLLNAALWWRHFIAQEAPAQELPIAKAA
jgi:asparagine synthase (glutamine-hydrolysing)